jgi:hypothetical protein
MKTTRARIAEKVNLKAGPIATPMSIDAWIFAPAPHNDGDEQTLLHHHRH